MTERPLGVAVIGCGFIGQRRARTLQGARLVGTADVLPERAATLARTVEGCVAVEDWRSLLSRDEVDVCVVATLHDTLAEITLACVEAGRHVLVEKPAARTAAELAPVMAAAAHRDVRVRVGFNHRYHRALRKADELIKTGALGDLLFIRGRYGHGGRLGYDREWRADPARSGGGELIDQGPHLIDLARCFLGDFSDIQGFAKTYFWDMPVDDNGFLLLKTPDDRVAFLHVSCTEWKNLFSLEIYGRDGKIDVSGLGGSYGPERIAYYRMLPAMGPPETTIWEYPMADDSWAVEFAEFLDDIRLGREPAASLADARAVLEIIETIYERSGYDHHA